MTNNSLGDWELCIIVPPTLSSLSVEPSVRDSSRLLGWSNLRYCKPSRQRNPSNPSSHFQVLEPPPSKLDSIGLNSLNITHYRKNLKQPSPAISSLYFLFLFFFLVLVSFFSLFWLPFMVKSLSGCGYQKAQSNRVLTTHLHCSSLHRLQVSHFTYFEAIICLKFKPQPRL